MILGIFAVVFLLLRLPSLFEPYWYGDEGIYLTIGQALRHGVTLFSQIHDNKPPTLYYLAALGHTVFGFRFLLLLWMVPTIYVFYLLAKKFLKRPLDLVSTFLFLLLTCIPLVEGNIANAEIFMLLPTIGGIYLFLNSQSRFKYLYTGLLLGFAFTIKVPVAIEFGFLCLWLIIFNLKKITTVLGDLINLVLGFFLPIFLWAIYFILKGAFSQFIFAALLQNFGYLSSWATGTHSGSATGGGLFTRLIILGIAWAIMYYGYLKKVISKNELFLLAWFAATIFGVLLSTRPYPHYLIQLLPPLCLSLAYLSTKKIFLVVPLFLAFILIHYRFYYYPVFGYYGNFYFHGNQKTYFNANIDSTYQIAQYIDSRSTPEDRIFIWGDDPDVYVLSNRLPVTKYIVAYHIVDFNGYQLTMDQLKAQAPRFIIYYSMDNRPFSELDQFTTLFYRPVAGFGNAVIYQRR